MIGLRTVDEYCLNVLTKTFTMKYRTSIIFLLVVLCIIAGSNCSVTHNSGNADSENTNNETKNDKSLPVTSDSQETIIKTNETNSKIVPTSTPKSKILYDFREIDKFRPQPKFGSVEKKLVLDFAFGITKGEFSGTDSILQRFDGSFTSSGVRETLYVASGGSDEPRKILAVYEGTKPLYKFEYNGQEIIKIIDLNNDGRNEILSTTGDVYLYGRDLDLQIVRINRKDLETLKTFKNVLSSNDSQGHETTLAEVAVISYTTSIQTGVFPTEFNIVRYTCKGAGGAIESKSCHAKKN